MFNQEQILEQKLNEANLKVAELEDENEKLRFQIKNLNSRISEYSEWINADADKVSSWNTRNDPFLTSP